MRPCFGKASYSYVAPAQAKPATSGGNADFLNISCSLEREQRALVARGQVLEERGDPVDAHDDAVLGEVGELAALVAHDEGAVELLHVALEVFAAAHGDLARGEVGADRLDAALL